jgi:hypothetical protein
MRGPVTLWLLLIASCHYTPGGLAGPASERGDAGAPGDGGSGLSPEYEGALSGPKGREM